MIKDRSLKIGVVCGEHSGDTLGAHLISELKKHKDIELLGVGGPKLENLGLNSQFNFEELQIMGIVDPILNYRNLSMRRKKLTESLSKGYKPHVLFLVQIQNIEKFKIFFITDNKKKLLSTNIRFRLRVPRVDNLLSPLLLTIPLQLLAYHVELLKNFYIDKPRNLAKSVTVE